MKVLIANRGEIALRIMRACRELGFQSVAVYSSADQESLPVRYADEAIHIGSNPAVDSYLRIDKVIKAALDSGADAIHPGYGFFSESSEFAQAVEDAGLIFVGPRSETVALTGDKLAARRIAKDAGLPVLPGSGIADQQGSTEHGQAAIVFPVLIKAVSGGGGRGIRLANNPSELDEMIKAAKEEAQTSFGDDSVYYESLVEEAHHVEIQILGDGHGQVLVLGERECSIQRRHQKIIEEAPSLKIDYKLRKEIYQAAVNIGKTLNYRSLGTVEFLIDKNGQFFFIEVNPRVQVEHPVTEMVTGIDLIRTQLLLEIDQTLKYAQADIIQRGSSIEARVLAEDPENGFFPSMGEITYLNEPAGPGVRVDSALFKGMHITSDYDSLLAKVIVLADERKSAIQRLKRALHEFKIGGIPTNIELLIQILESDSFDQGVATTTYLDNFQFIPNGGEIGLEEDLALAAALLEHKIALQQEPSVNSKNRPGYWHYQAWREQLRHS